MKRLLGLMAMLVVGGAAAEGFPCPEPQYAFLKDAGKDELRYEYCRLTRKALSNERAHRHTREMIEEKKALELYESKDGDKALSELQAAGTCKVAAGAVADALAKRFKQKPTTSCT